MEGLVDGEDMDVTVNGDGGRCGWCRTGQCS